MATRAPHQVGVTSRWLFYGLLCLAVPASELHSQATSKGTGGSSPSGAAPAGASAIVPLKISNEPGVCELVGDQKFIDAHDPDLSDLKASYNSGDWRTVQTRLADFVAHLICHAPDHDPKHDYHLSARSSYFSVLFLDDATTLPAPTLARVLVHVPVPDLYSLHVIGTSLYDISLLQTTAHSASAQPMWLAQPRTPWKPA